MCEEFLPPEVGRAASVAMKVKVKLKFGLKVEPPINRLFLKLYL